MRRSRSWLPTIAIVAVTTAMGMRHPLGSVGFATEHDPQIVDVQKIWSQPAHQSFFTDLIRYRGAWVCCFREAATHGSADGYIQLIGSSDGQRWVGC